MRIAFLTTEYPTNFASAGGIASNTHRTASLLTSLGHDCEVFLVSSKRQTTMDADGVTVHDVPCASNWERRVARFPLLRRMLGYTKVASRSCGLARALRGRSQEVSFDVVQAVSSHAAGLASTYRRVAPVVSFANCYNPAIRRAEGRQASRQEAQIDRASFRQLRRSNAVHAPSRLVAGLLRDEQGIAAEIIEYAYDLAPMAHRRWQPPDELAPNSYGLFFGTLNRLKGCDRLVQLLPQLLEADPERRFVFIGRPQSGPDGQPFDDYIRRQLAAFGPRIQVLAPQRPETLFRYVAHSRFVVLPSRTDNLPNTCLESMALRRVVVATRDASFEQLITDGETGLLASQTDDTELAHKMAEAWNLEDARRQTIGDAALASLDRFRPEVAIQPLLDLYQRVAAQGRGR